MLSRKRKEKNLRVFFSSVSFFFVHFLNFFFFLESHNRFGHGRNNFKLLYPSLDGCLSLSLSRFRMSTLFMELFRSPSDVRYSIAESLLIRKITGVDSAGTLYFQVGGTLRRRFV